MLDYFRPNIRWTADKLFQIATSSNKKVFKIDLINKNCVIMLANLAKKLNIRLTIFSGTYPVKKCLPDCPKYSVENNDCTECVSLYADKQLVDINPHIRPSVVVGDKLFTNTLEKKRHVGILYRPYPICHTINSL
jgi:hypothetical protein